MDSSLVSGTSSTSSTTARSVGSSSQQTASWVVSFDNLLNDEDGVSAFAAFLEKEYSAENIHFWMDCQKLRKMTNPKEIRRTVKNMYSLYFAHTACQPINVDSHARQGADADILDPNNQSFRAAECQVYSLMRDDSYARFLRSDLFATRVKQEISSGESSSSKKDAKDHGLVSWYKTSLRPRLSRSIKKRPKSVGNLGNAPSTSSSSLPGSSSAAMAADQAKMSGDDSDTQSASCNPSSSSSLQTQPHVQHPSSSLPSTIPESPQTPPRPSCSGASGCGENSPSKTHRESLSRFTISPLSPFNLNTEREFEDFFAQVVSCSQKAPDVQAVGEGTLKFASSIFHSQPCIPDLSESVRTTLPSSPSLHDVFDSVSRKSRGHHHVHGYPPPPVPPKSGRLPHPLPPPAKSATMRRNLHSYDALYV